MNKTRLKAVFIVMSLMFLFIVVKNVYATDIGGSQSGDDSDYVNVSGTNRGIWTIKGSGNDLTLELTINGETDPNNVASSDNDPWYEYYNRISKVIINDGCTEISNYTFFGWSNLKEVVLPDSLTKIDHSAFCDCSSLTDINLPDSLTTISGNVFMNESHTIVGSTFENCTSLEYISIPAAVSSIPERCFAGCKKLSTVEFRSRVSKYNIGYAAFEECSNLSNIDLSMCERIGQSSFSCCAGLKDVILSQCYMIDGKAFYQCYNLKNLTIPNCPKIDVNAFAQCNNLNNITIEGTINNGTGYIAENAFYFQNYFSVDNPVTINIDNKEAWDKSKLKTYLNDTIASGTVQLRFWDYSVILETTEHVMRIGSNLHVDYTVDRDLSTIGEIIWISSDPDVVTVDDAGNITSNAIGEAEIYIKAENGVLKNTVQVAVVGETSPEKIWFDEETFEIGQGQTLPARSINFSPDDSTEIDITWESSDPFILSVTENGEIQGKKVGQATLYANVGPCRASCNVDVIFIHATGITVSESEITLAAGKNHQLSATVLPEEASDKTVQWSSNNTTVATVDEYGNVSAKKAGIATITAKSNDNGVNATCKVTVVRPAVSLSENQKVIAEGQSFKLTNTILPANETYDGSWNSSNTDVASVDENGIVTAHNIGTASISYSITYDGNPGIETATCTVSVVETWNSFDFDEKRMFVGDSIFIDTASISDEEITWTYTSNGIVVINDEGFLKATDYGTTSVIGNGKDGTEVGRFNVIVMAKGTCGNSAQWHLDEEGTLTISGSGQIADYTSSTSGSAPWNSLRLKINSIKIEEGITSIGKYAFNNCTKVSDITLPASLMSIGDRAFQSCESLTDINIAERTQSIGTYAFSGCTKLTRIYIPKSVTSLGSSFLYRCNSLENIVYEGSKTEWQNVSGYGYVTDQSLLRYLGYTMTIISPNPLILRVNTEKQVLYTIDYDLNSIGTIAWETSDPDVATVNEEGLITGKEVGETGLTIKAENGMVKGSINVIVVGSTFPESIKFADESLKLERGKTYQAPVIIFEPEDTTERAVRWESSDTTTLNVDQDGILTPLKTGTVTLYARAGFCEAQCEVQIVVLPHTIVIESNSASIETGTSTLLSANVLPEDTTNKDVVWISSDESIATVDNAGNVTGIKAGNVIIRAASEECSDIYGEYNLQVIQRVSDVTISEEDATIPAGKTHQLNATVLPEDSTNQSVRWISENPEIASVDDTGLVSGKKAGITIITASTIDGDLTATCEVTVVQPAVVIDKQQIRLPERKQIKLNCSIRPEGTEYDYSWSSSDPDIADVNQDGLVTAKSIGKAVISYTITYDGDPGIETVSCEVEVPATWNVIDSTEYVMNIEDVLYLDSSNCWNDSTIELNWLSSDSDIVSIVDNAYAIANANGTAIIKGSDDEGAHEITKRIKVVTPVSGVEIDESDLFLSSGDSYYIYAYVSPYSASNKNVTWISSDESIVRIDSTSENGSYAVIIAGSQGIAYITATTEDGNYTDRIKVTVNQRESGTTGKEIKWTVTADSTEEEGYALYLEGNGMMPNYSSNSSPWMSYAEDITEVHITEGIQNISNHAFENMRITDLVIPESVTSIGANALQNCKNLKEVTIPLSVTEIGQDCFKNDSALQFICYEGDEDAWDQLINNSGVEMPQSVRICFNTSRYVPVAGIRISGAESNIKVRDQIQLEATIQPKNATIVDYIWSSSDDAIATISNTGLVTASSVGTVKIFATPLDGGKEIRGEYVVTVAALPIEEMKISEITDQQYTGSSIQPVVVIKDGNYTLEEGKDYTLKYDNNTNAGSATIVVNGQGNYGGTISKTFDILPGSIKEVSISGLVNKTFTGHAITQTPTVKHGTSILKEDIDYTIAYKNNTNAGTATIIITGKGNYSGTKTATFVIDPDKNEQSEESTNEKQETSAAQTEKQKADASAADIAAKQIADVPAIANITLADKSGIDTAAKAYDALSADQKKLVPAATVKKLEEAKKLLAEMEAEAVAEEKAGHKTVEATTKTMTALSDNADPANSDYATLALKVKKVSKKSIKLQWKNVKGAAGYIIYANKCGRSNKYQQVADVKGASKKSFTLKKVQSGALKKNTYYKVIVAAYKVTKGGEQRVISTSKSIHVATAGGKNGNPVKLKLNKKKVTVKIKKTVKLKAKQKAKSGTKIKKHRKLKFESSNPKIATVSKKGVIKGKKKGKCTVYVYAQNGVSAKVKVTVKK